MNRYLAVITLAFAFLYSACSQKQEQTVQPPAVTANKKTHKPGAPVNLIEPQPVTLYVNQAATLVIRLQTPPQGRLVVNFSTKDGLQLVDTETTQVVELNATEVALPVHVLPLNNGRFYLNIDVALETAEAISSRTLALAIQVGEPLVKALKPSVQTLSSEDNKSYLEPVISLPAQETIKP